MTQKILTLLFVFINSIVSATGYAGITLLMAIESACIPLPSELIMPFAGYLVYAGRMKLVWAATAGAIGCNLGSLVAYEIGCYGGRPLVERYGRWLLMEPGSYPTGKIPPGKRWRVAGDGTAVNLHRATRQTNAGSPTSTCAQPGPRPATARCSSQFGAIGSRP